MAEVPIPPTERKLDPRGRPRLDGLQAWYTLPELAQRAGRSRWQMETWIKAVGEHLIHQPGGPGTLRGVYVHELKQAAPGLWNSLLDLEEARLQRARLGVVPRRRSTDVDADPFPSF